MNTPQKEWICPCGRIAPAHELCSKECKEKYTFGLSKISHAFNSGYDKGREHMREEIVEMAEEIMKQYPIESKKVSEFEVAVNWANPLVHQALTDLIERVKDKKAGSV